MAIIFDETYFNGDQGYKEYKKYIHFTERALWVSNNLTGKILEIGSAYGYLLEELFNIDDKIDIAGIDISSYAVSQAHSSIASKITTVDIKDITTSGYDWVISWNVLDCLDDETHASQVAEKLNAIGVNQYHVLSMSGERYTKQGYFIRDYSYWRNLLPNASLVDYETGIVYTPDGKMEKAQVPLCWDKVSN